MLFSSLIFLFIFLPLLVVVYYILPKKFRNYILLLFSLVFYAWGGVSYTIILIVSVAINFFFVKQLEQNKKQKKKWLIFGLTFNILVIVVFKYLDFIIENINVIGGYCLNDFTELPLKHIVLPLGISFFTFQQMSLLWDVYRDENSQKATFSNIALYISLFPQLIAGPIVRYNDIISQIKIRVETIELFRSGIQRFLVGLFKKIIIANSCGEIADSIMSNSIDNINTPIAWLGIISYTFQIYFDFSGYSDMAIGLGRMFGFKILENFNFPYISQSIQEFWRRWHISLSSWFKDYVYIPLGGNRNKPYKTYFNLSIVFLLTGIWHGATWSFVLWGLFHGLFLIIEKLGFNKILNKLPAIVRWCYTILIVIIGWVFFRIEELPDAFSYIAKLFGSGEFNNFHLVSYLNKERVIILILATLFSSTIFDKIRLLLDEFKISKTIFYKISVDITLIGVFVYSVMYINSGSYNPFIYFRF
ncbi:MAG: MBOAT family O-acyltransferase [Flavobacteriales bacterium]|nr:MBOAT family O-acyltransferase [Flavobacteriales bacterium]